MLRPHRCTPARPRPTAGDSWDSSVAAVVGGAVGRLRRCRLRACGQRRSRSAGHGLVGLDCERRRTLRSPDTLCVLGHCSLFPQCRMIAELRSRRLSGGDRTGASAGQPKTRHAPAWRSRCRVRPRCETMIDHEDDDHDRVGDRAPERDGQMTLRSSATISRKNRVIDSNARANHEPSRSLRSERGAGASSVSVSATASPFDRSMRTPERTPVVKLSFRRRDGSRSCWQGRQDLNLQPPVLETGALPIEPRPFVPQRAVTQGPSDPPAGPSARSMLAHGRPDPNVEPRSGSDACARNPAAAAGRTPTADQTLSASVITSRVRLLGVDDVRADNLARSCLLDLHRRRPPRSTLNSPAMLLISEPSLGGRPGARIDAFVDARAWR